MWEINKCLALKWVKYANFGLKLQKKWKKPLKLSFFGRKSHIFFYLQPLLAKNPLRVTYQCIYVLKNSDIAGFKNAKVVGWLLAV